MEEFHPQVKHVAGKDNDAADALSRLDMIEDPRNTLDWGPINRSLTYKEEKNEQINLLFPVAADRDMAHQFPLSLDLIRLYQDWDPTLINKLNTRGHTLTTKVIEGFNLLHKPTQKGVVG